MKAFKPKFLSALEDGTLPVIKSTLAEAEHLKFEIKEHAELKALCAKLEEEEAIRLQLEEMERQKAEKSRLEMEEMIRRAAHAKHESE